jgi:hypothetical protein
VYDEGDDVLAEIFNTIEVQDDIFYERLVHPDADSVIVFSPIEVQVS